MTEKAKSPSLLKSVLSILLVCVLLVGVGYVNYYHMGYSSIGAWEVLQGERSRVLYLGYQEGKRSEHDSIQALLRDAETGEPLAKADWGSKTSILEIGPNHLWLGTGRGLALYDAKTLELLLGFDAILKRNSFLSPQVSRARSYDRDSTFPTTFDPATGRLLVKSGGESFVLSPSGEALAVADVAASTPPLTPKAPPPKKGPCSPRKQPFARFCGAPQRCIQSTKAGPYGGVSMRQHGLEVQAEKTPATFIEPTPVYIGQHTRCVEPLDDLGSVLVTHKTSPQAPRPDTLSMIRPDGAEVWRVPLETLGDGAQVDLAVRAKNAVRVYGSIHGDIPRVGGDFGIIMTLNPSTGEVLSRVKITH